MLLIYGLLMLCAVALVAAVFRYDLYDKEPVIASVLCAAMGAAAMDGAGRTQVWMMSHWGQAASNSVLGAVEASHVGAVSSWTLNMAAAAGASEELGKFLCVLVMAVFARRWFNDPLDGLIYGALAGIGGALEESVNIMLHLDPPPRSLPATEPVRLTGHLIMGAITCFGLGALASRRGSAPAGSSPGKLPFWTIPACFAAGVALHSAWDVVAFQAQQIERMTVDLTAYSLVIMAAGFILFRLLVRLGSGFSRSATACA